MPSLLGLPGPQALSLITPEIFLTGPSNQVYVMALSRRKEGRTDRQTSRGENKRAPRSLMVYCTGEIYTTTS